MVAPASLKNLDSQSVVTLYGQDASLKLMMAVGGKTAGGLTAQVAWQGVASHVDGETFDASDGVLVIAGVDGSTVRRAVANDDGSVQTSARPHRGTLVDQSDAITLGGTRQEVCAANPDRAYLLFVNISDTTMWINFGTNAVADKPSIPISAGGSFVMEAGFVSTESLDVMCATTGKKFVAKEA